MAFFYTYVLLSKKDCKYYVGWTDNLRKRIAKHQKGLVLATEDRLPVELVYYEACISKSRAISREKYFKTGFGRRFLKSRV
jgi:putative endonuclease